MHKLIAVCCIIPFFTTFIVTDSGKNETRETCLGDELQLECPPAGANNLITWIKDGKKLFDGSELDPTISNIVVLNDSFIGQYNLCFERVGQGHNGIYSCVYNSNGSNNLHTQQITFVITLKDETNCSEVNNRTTYCTEGTTLLTTNTNLVFDGNWPYMMSGWIYIVSAGIVSCGLFYGSFRYRKQQQGHAPREMNRGQQVEVNDMHLV